MIKATSRGEVIEIAEVHTDGSVDQLGEFQTWQGQYLYFPDASLVNGGLTLSQMEWIYSRLKELNEKPA